MQVAGRKNLLVLMQWDYSSSLVFSTLPAKLISLLEIKDSIIAA